VDSVIVGGSSATDKGILEAKQDGDFGFFAEHYYMEYNEYLMGFEEQLKFMKENDVDVLLKKRQLPFIYEDEVGF
jgi:hypothetical protein